MKLRISYVVQMIALLVLSGCNGDKKPITQGGEYHNVFTECGISEDEVQDRISQVEELFFEGGEQQRLYYEFGDDMAYIFDVNNNDIRSEGMSYGMMLCVQLNRREEFDKLWKFSHDIMRYKEGDNTGYFAWQFAPDGTKMADYIAPDGEEYYAMALLFAANRWGSGEGLYNYQAQADSILDHMVRHTEIQGLSSGSWTTNIIHPKTKQIVFSPFGGAAEYTDPSYHLPHFYELFALWASDHNRLWSEVAAESRLLFQKACHPETGLAPDYSHFDGVPVKKGRHYRFEYDAWRVAMNISLDYYWWQKDPWQKKEWVKTFQRFFAGQGIGEYPSLFDVDGSHPGGVHSEGLVAMNAMTSLITGGDISRQMVLEFWNTPFPQGQYRYFDGCLYFFALLNLAGEFKIIGEL